MHCSFHLGLRGGGSVFLSFLLLGSPAAALSPPPPQPDDELLPLLYETMGGENWHNNDGWLDPDVHWCDWYGVECGEEWWPGYFDLDALTLPDNSLSGEMTETLTELLFGFVEDELDLSGNDVSGEMVLYPRSTARVDLSGNRLSGSLHEISDPEGLLTGQRLFLDRNDFSGTIPESWSQARLKILDLSNNQLTGGHQAAIDAINPNSGDGYVYLTGNPLEGELTDTVLSAPLSERDELGDYGGIDICFTNLTVEDPEVREWLAEHHVASSDFEQCQNRERTAVDATLSGSWYSPKRSGEGVSLMMLENGAPLLYSFSFDLDGNQQWTFEVGNAGEQWAAWDALKETRGTFNEGIRCEEDYTFIRPIAEYRVDRVGPDTVNLYRRYTDFRSCPPWGAPSDEPFYPCPLYFHTDRMDYRRLTELAGTTCENGNEFQQYSGAWYNPERSGEGFVVEVLPNERAVVYWFTYKPDGSGEQAWMIGDGEMSREPQDPARPFGHTARLSVTLFQPSGGFYGPDFDPTQIELVEWGEVNLEFNTSFPHPGEVGGRVVGFESVLDGYGSGEYVLEPLAGPMLAECGGGEGS